jgi:hypothetical protein
MVADESWKRIAPHFLTWPDVDPAEHPFDPAQALAVVREISPPVPPRPPGSSYRAERQAAEQWRRAVSHGLVDRYGRWAAGWCWAPGEGDYDGGPVGGWCCPDHSITTPDATLELVAECLIEWRGWLEDLAGRFERLRPDPGADPHDDWELAISRLVVASLDRTSCMSGWHGHCALVLSWFLTYAGVPGDDHDTMIEDAIGGSFQSWTEPSPMTISHVAERLAEAVTGQRPGPPCPEEEPAGSPGRSGRPRPPRDSLRDWLNVRSRVSWDTIASAAAPARTGRDSIADYVERRGDGGDELSEALDQVRIAAATGAPLTFGLLAGWQAAVLGVPSAAFRSGPAWAKRGRERYHWEPGLPEQFERHLAEANDARTPLASRAARAYLDICFYHPFDDGNGRAALLTLAFLLERENVVLERAAPILRTAWYAHDRRAAAALTRLIDRNARSSAGLAGAQ